MKASLLLASVALFVSTLVFGQETGKVEIKGVVKDSKGIAIQGITITEKNTTNVAATNATGEFTIRVRSASATLVFSGVGFQTKETKVEEGKTFSIVMAEDVKELSDVVVVGYGTQNKAKITGAVSSVKMDDILGDRPVTTTQSLLQGAVPGLQVTINSGQPGASSNLNVRGGTSFGSSLTSGFNTASPLILVDNIPLNGPLNLIDPNDIETVTVLKDAGSAAIYGARSAFGVVLITTKKGTKNQKAQFNYSNNFVFSTPTNLPKKASPLQMVQSLIDGGRTGYYAGQDLATWKQLLQEYEANPGKYPLGSTTANNVFYQLAPTDAVEDLLGNNAFQQMHNLSITGGSDKTTYRISLGATDENGIILPSVKHDNYTRYNLKSFISTDVTSWFNAQVDASYYNSMNTSPYYSNAFGDATNFPSFLSLDSIPGITGVIASPKNTVAMTAASTSRYDDIRLTGRVILKPYKDLSITGEYSFDNLRNLATDYDQKVDGLLNPYTLTAGSLGSSLFQKTNALTDYRTLNIFGTYLKKLNGHNFTLMGGFNQESKYYEQEVLSKTMMINSGIPSISTGSGVVNGTDNYSEFATRGFFGRLGYDYNGKYLVELNGRYDGSSRFPDGHRWGFFPSGSVGWRLSEENFMRSLKPVLSEFKLRASYGTVGNQNIAEYQFFGGMNPTQPFWYNGGSSVITLNPPGLISPDFTWETVSTLDFGANFGLFKNKLTGAFDWYQRDTKDILSSNDTPVPATLGTSAPLINAASLRTKGWEAELNYKDKIGKVSYFIGFNIFDYNSVVTSVNNPNKLLSQLYVGKNMGEIWGYVTDRFYTVDDFVAGTLDGNLKNGTLKTGVPKIGGQSPNPGDIMYKDLNGDGVISQAGNTLSDAGDRKIIGNNTMHYQYGIRGGVSYMNFDFSFVVSGVGQQDQWRADQLIFPNYWQTYGSLYAHQTNYWTADKANSNPFYGRIYTDAAGGTAQTFNQNVQTKFLQNGSYLRVRNLTLRYNFQVAMLKKIGIKRLSVNYSVENPFTFHNLPDGLYPDVTSIGSTAGGGLGYPFMMKSSFGLNLSF
jgi:TonB-linked SusC/RagA family outer membrane protein